MSIPDQFRELQRGHYCDFFHLYAHQVLERQGLRVETRPGFFNPEHTLIDEAAGLEIVERYFDEVTLPKLWAKHKEKAKQQKADPRHSASRPSSSNPRRRGRPKKADALPAIYGNPRMERFFSQAGLTTTEKTIARKLLALLRAEHVAVGRGKFINRSSLGSDRTVKRTFSKLRSAGLITDSRPVKGHNQTRLTNLGPVFLNGLTGQSEGPNSTDLRGQSDGPILAPQTPNFDTTKTLANTGEVDAILAPRFINPLKRVHREPLSLASASLRAAASEHGQSMQQSDQSNQSIQTVETMPAKRLINGLSNPLNLANGDQVKYKDQISTVVSFCWESDLYLIRIVESGDMVRCGASQLNCIS